MLGGRHGIHGDAVEAKCTGRYLERGRTTEFGTLCLTLTAQ